MKLTIWQFVLLVAIIIGLYYLYSLWWVHQDRKAWSDKFSSWIIKSEEEDDTSKPPPPPAKSDGWIR
jgi:hypothetical protein